MIIKKKFNNNVLMSTDYKNREVILIGNGLAFNVKPGEQVDESKIEKVFRLESDSTPEEFIDFLENISAEQLVLVREIISYGEEVLDFKLGKHLYLSLNDHIENAVERHQKNQDISNPLLWEIKQIYPTEFQVAKQALSLINDYYSVELSEDEAGFIALHFVNAQQRTEKMHQTMQIPKIVKDILVIIAYHFNQELDTSSLSYERFLVHLKFFAHRVITNQDFPSSSMTMLTQLSQAYPKVYSCVEKINKYMNDTQGITISDDEQFYLMVHIQRVLDN